MAFSTSVFNTSVRIYKGERRGWGRAKYREGERYEGEWRGGVREGLGVCLYISKDMTRIAS